MAKVACIMMQKDEEFLLGPWLAYHGHLFGLDNLFVIDNGSTSPAVRATLDRFAARGVHVDRSHPTRDDYLNKGEIVGQTIRRLEADGGHELFFPTDCDEFILKRTDAGFTCDRQSINAYLDTLRDEAGTLRIPYQIANHPLLPDFYCYFDFRKTFYAAGAFGWTDHGHHVDGSRGSRGFRDTLIVHAHFHFHPFARHLELARRKWNSDVNPDDLDRAREYRGASMHLAPYFHMTAAEYYGQFATKPLFHLPQLRRLLTWLGAPLNLPPDDASGVQPDLGEATCTPMYLPFEWNEQAYLDANPDVRDANLGGAYHFALFGHREGRALPPFRSAGPEYRKVDDDDQA